MRVFFQRLSSPEAVINASQAIGRRQAIFVIEIQGIAQPLVIGSAAPTAPRSDEVSSGAASMAGFTEVASL